MSLAGASSAGVAQLLMPLRPWLLGSGALLLLAALWTAFRNDSAVFTRFFSAAAALTGFAWSLRVLGVFDV
jgi:hypothetical protein